MRLGPRRGILVLLSLVKTDENCSFSMSAFPLGQNGLRQPYSGVKHQFHIARFAFKEGVQLLGVAFVTY